MTWSLHSLQPEQLLLLFSWFLLHWVLFSTLRHSVYEFLFELNIFLVNSIIFNFVSWFILPGWFLLNWWIEVIYIDVIIDMYWLAFEMIFSFCFFLSCYCYVIFLLLAIVGFSWLSVLRGCCQTSAPSNVGCHGRGASQRRNSPRWAKDSKALKQQQPATIPSPVSVL